MISRFQGPEGKPRVVTALRRQSIVQDDAQLAGELSELVEIIQFEPGSPNDALIVQGTVDNHLDLILAGCVSVRIQGREVAKRTAGQHVGEMALIDPSARRSATVVPIEQTVVARISETIFTQLANKYPQLWRHLAVDLASRLRQRGDLIKPPNESPFVFVGSSAEGLQVARVIQSGLGHDPMVVSVWTDGVFRASRAAIESLLDEVAKSDFAILVLTADDTVISREVVSNGPRDNCIFELGLFMGALGRDRTFIVKPRGVDIKIPSDLLGITLLEYPIGNPETLSPRIAPLCTIIRNTIGAMGPK
jgi:CRP/FNR family cyclic AMP-dependent transcriptional regulator